ncbi:hypothetical protein KIW84_036101 [Lathyrus oleraceus]|uniref:Uncharacterized protein n=1 Tax=Pisum sativum TaxID=3888 RepID=A0A9D4Y392_PEA|nr:hypothetical protein KIW84_036101 [Pisum sativum]
MNCTKVSIFKQTNQVSFSCFLKCRNGTALESEICFEILSDFPNQSLERKLPYEKFGALLILPNLSQSNSSWTESVRLLHTSGRRSRFPSSFCRQLFPWSFSSGGFASGLFGTCHFDRKENERNFLQFEFEKGMEN